MMSEAKKLMHSTDVALVSEELTAVMKLEKLKPWKEFKALEINSVILGLAKSI